MGVSDQTTQKRIAEFVKAHGKPGKGNYHNKEFRTKAESVGLLIDLAGVTRYAPTSPFVDLLKKHGLLGREPGTDELQEAVTFLEREQTSAAAGTASKKSPPTSGSKPSHVRGIVVSRLPPPEAKAPAQSSGLEPARLSTISEFTALSRAIM